MKRELKNLWIWLSNVDICFSNHTLYSIRSAGKAQRAIRVFEELVREFPEDKEAKKNLGVQHLIIGHNGKAKPYFKQVAF